MFHLKIFGQVVMKKTKAVTESVDNSVCFLKKIHANVEESDGYSQCPRIERSYSLFLLSSLFFIYFFRSIGSIYADNVHFCCQTQSERRNLKTNVDKYSQDLTSTMGLAAN